jgi:cation:H+ antiporter
MDDWVTFALSASVIIVAGSALAVLAEVIVRRTGLGSLWFGAVAVAFVTSLPELVTGISAVRRDAVGLALGDLFGASMLNMAILAAVTLLFTTRRLLQRAALENVLSAMLAVSLTALAVMLIAVDAVPAVGGVALGSIALAAGYLGGGFAIRERQAAADVEEHVAIGANISLLTAQIGFLAAAAAILAAGPLLAGSADRLADRTGAGETFFGAVAVALVTCLPELSVSISALRIGAFNLAVANLMGSNATNMALILPLDLAYDGPPILEQADAGILAAAGAAIVLTSIGTTAIVLKAERSRLPVDLAAVLMLVVYMVGVWAVHSAT